MFFKEEDVRRRRNKFTVIGGDMTDYCPQCNTVVAPHDPNKEKWGTQVFHGGCRKKLQDRAALRNETVTLIHRGNETRIAFVSLRR